MNFIISILKSDSFEFVLNAKIDDRKTNSKNFTGHWVQLFESHVNTHDKYTRVKLQGTRARLYETLGRKGVNYFSANAFCKTCKAAYKFTIKNSPPENRTHVDVDVSHDAHSDHSTKPSQNLQIRGEDRVKVAEEVLLRFKGSAKVYVDEKRSTHNVYLSQDVVRKVVNEYVNGDLVSTCWIINMLHAIDMAEATIIGKKINGFVQQFEVNNG